MARIVAGRDCCRIDTVDRQLASIDARLVVHAEGSAADDGALGSDYRQDALICVARPRHAHRHRAWERFSALGPLALLPQGDDYAVVFVLGRDAGEVLQRDDAAFIAALETRLGGRLQFREVGARSRHALRLRLRPQVSGERRVWLGNAAQSLHPVSGQGLNLGLRDVACLRELLAEARGHGGNGGGHDSGGDDAGAIAAAYGRSRIPDRVATLGLTDFLVRGFAGDCGALRLARGAALAGCDLSATTRSALAGQMIFGQRP